MNFPHPIVDSLRQHREQQGITQREAARRMGLSPSVLAQWETGRCGPTLKNVEKFAALLGYGLVLEFRGGKK